MIQSDKNKNKVFDRGEWRFPERKKKSQKNGTSNGSNEPGHKMMESSTLQANTVLSERHGWSKKPRQEQ